jgi:hypothetical protein
MSRRKRYTRNLGRPATSPLPARETIEWVRFEHEREPYGLFSYGSDAREVLGSEQFAELESLIAWFGDHLDAPELDDDADDRFWFRAEAHEHVTRARRIAELLVVAGIPIVERRTLRVPGKVRWEDSHQVCVLTYRDAPRPKR